MKKSDYYHQKFFRFLYRDMVRRIDKYKTILQIKNEKERKRRERIFLEEQQKIISRFISQEEYARHKLKEGLKSQQRDIESWWKRNIEFRKVKRECLNRLDYLIVIAKEVEEILKKEQFDQSDVNNLISKITREAIPMMQLSEDFEIRKYGQGILDFCKRNKSPIALAILFIFMSSAAVYVFTNYHIIPKDTQTVQVSFTADDMYASDWAAGAHFSYGFYTMIDRIVDTYLGRRGEHKSYLAGLEYRAREDQRYGNQDANILEIHKGASLLLPNNIRNMLGDNIVVEVQALNKGETVIMVLQNNNIILNVRFNQDKVASIGTNSYNFSDPQLEETYHTIRLNLEKLVNAN